ncbi:Rv3235 family protein [Lapillicoccus jejuensis]|uniref:Rv3235 family protein n=1 Tax=Lapillicoccus jejuensis TaxID=402171 RepID=UPI0031E4159E
MTPVPRREPPVISADEAFAPAPAPTGYVQGALALAPAPFPSDARARGGLPARRAVAAGPVDDEPDPLFDRQPTSRVDLPPPGPFAARIGQALVEVLWGARPAVQVVRWTSQEVHAVVARRSLVAARRGLRARRPPVVRRVRVCEPADGVAEVGLVVVDGDRVRAVALRLTGLDGRWVITELQVG